VEFKQIKIYIVLLGIFAIPLSIQAVLLIRQEVILRAKFNSIDVEKELIGVWRSIPPPKFTWIVDNRTYNRDKTFNGSLQVEKNITKYSGTYEVKGHKIIHRVNYSGNGKKMSAWEFVKQRIIRNNTHLDSVGVYENELIELNNDYLAWKDSYPPNEYVRVKEELR
jgi:hypothetical protein